LIVYIIGVLNAGDTGVSASPYC